MNDCFDFFVWLTFSDEIGHVHRHFDNARLVKFFQFFQNAHVVVSNKIDCDSFATKTTTTTDTGKKKE